MIGSFINALVNFCIHIIQVFLNPIESLIATNIPDLSTGLASLSSVIDYIINSMGFVKDCVGLSSTATALIVGYLSFAFTMPLAVWVIKVAVKWWHALVP